MLMDGRTLVTGFGPFPGVEDNPSAALARESGEGHRILEVSYEAAEAFVRDVDAGSFDRLLLIGVAASRDHLSLELFARNGCGRAPDVTGCVRAGRILDDSPLLLPTTLFEPEASAQIIAGEPRLRFSLDAGGYLCNFIYYRCLAAFPSKRIGFLHVPPPDRIGIEEQSSLVRRVLDGL